MKYNTQHAPCAKHMPEDKLEKLREQSKVINARIRQEQSRRNKRTRKEDTRRKILAGAAVLSEAENRPDYKTFLYKLLDRFLTRPNDRALFDLPPLDAATEDKTLH